MRGGNASEDSFTRLMAMVVVYAIDLQFDVFFGCCSCVGGAAQKLREAALVFSRDRQESVGAGVGVCVMRNRKRWAWVNQLESNWLHTVGSPITFFFSSAPSIPHNYTIRICHTQVTYGWFWSHFLISEEKEDREGRGTQVLACVDVSRIDVLWVKLVRPGRIGVCYA